MTDTSVETIPPYRPYSAIQRDHAAYQAQQGKESTSVSRPVIEFVQQVIQLGVWFEDSDDRTAAQGIIDFWVSKSKSYRSADNPLTNPEIDTLLVDFNPTTVQKSIDLMEDWLRELPESDRVLHRRMLSRLIRVRDDGSVIVNTCTRDSFSDLEPPNRAQEILSKMHDFGVIRTASASNGLEIIQLRSRHLLTAWGRLEGVIERRKLFRTQANHWKTKGASDRSIGIGEARRWLRRQLVSIGKRYDVVWSWLIRAWGRDVLVQTDPFEMMPDVEYYRDRTPAEVEYLFEQRKLINEQTEWLRVLKGLFLVFVAGGCVMGYALYQIRANEKARLKEQEEHKLEQALSEQRAAAKELQSVEEKKNTVKRRARQRLKEIIILVRLLAQYHQYNSIKDYPRADAARWRLESGLLGMDQDDLVLYKSELERVGFEIEVKNSGICVDCTGKPLQIANKLRQLIAERTDADDQDRYDKDTITYINNIKQIYYTTTVHLADNLIAALDGKGDVTRPKTYLAASAYMDEFWVLYYGEMVVVESSAVGTAMKEFGDLLREFDRIYYAQLERELAAKPLANPKYVNPLDSQNAAAKSYQLQSANADSQARLAQRRTELLQQPIDDWAKLFTPAESAKLMQIKVKLREQQQKLTALLKAELKDSSSAVEVPPVSK